jgi:hypothetical protein
MELQKCKKFERESSQKATTWKNEKGKGKIIHGGS